ncbi:hypothetical protein WJX79_001433 [Trebouxia sp. C0005]
MLEMAWLFENTSYAEMLQHEKRESCELLSYHNRRVEDYEEYGDSDELVEDYKQIKLLERELENASEVAKGKAVRVWQYHGKIVVVAALLLGWCQAAGLCGVTNTIHDTVGQQHLLSAEALVGGPSRLDHKPPQITRLGQQSAKQLKSCMEACLQSTLLAQISSWLHQISQLLLPWGFLCSAGSGIAAMLQSVETGKLVLTLAIFATLTAAMASTIAKHKHYLCMQRPSSAIARRAKWNACFMAESAAQPKTHLLTMAELLQHADQDGADSMVILLLAGARLTWDFACGLSACLPKACHVLTAINFNNVKTLVSIVLWPCSFLATCRRQAGHGRVSSITSVGFWIIKRLPAVRGGQRPNNAQLQEAQAAVQHTSAALQQMTQNRDRLAAELQETRVNESSLINSIRARLAVNEETTDAACQQSRLDARAAHDLEQRLQHAKEAKKRSQRRMGVLADMLTFTRRDRDQTEERLTTAQTLISGLENMLETCEQLSDAHVVLESKLAAKNLKLEELQQRRKHDKEKLQMQGAKLSKWQGEVRRLSNLVLRNNINSSKFFEACATVRSQRSGKNDPDLAATAKALEAAAKAGRPFSSHIKAHPVGISVAGKQPVPKPNSCHGREVDQETSLRASSSSALLEAALDTQTIASPPARLLSPADQALDAFSLSSHHIGQLGSSCDSGQGTLRDTQTTAHAWTPLGPDHSSEAFEGINDLGVSMHGVLSHVSFQDMEGILLGESP